MPLKQVREGESRSLSRKEMFEQETVARWERYWLFAEEEDPECLERTWDLMKEHIPFKAGMKGADLGCGRGGMARKLQGEGLDVTAVDAASNALKGLQGQRVTLIQGCLPYLKLADALFDVVVCSDVIAELPQPLQRLLLSELSRLMTRDGFAVLSTPLDTRFEDSAETFAALFRTEFEIEAFRGTHRKRFFMRGDMTHCILIGKKRRI